MVQLVIAEKPSVARDLARVLAVRTSGNGCFEGEGQGHHLVHRPLGADGAPQAVVVGFAISDKLETVFDILASTRKHQNLKRDPRASLVIGWDDELTFQIEGKADFPTGEELRRMQACYFTVYPDGRDRLSWAGITHVRVRPTWIRMSDFKQNPPRIAEVAPQT